jgi:hypothetical protein
MTLSAVLLRVLLSLALVLNGIGSAVAAVHGHAGPASHDRGHALATAEVAPCHEHAKAAPADAGKGKGKGKGDGHCCDGARCHCACTAPGATAVPVVLLLSPAVAVTLATHRLDAGHRAPALAHPIRPPIG